MIVRLGNLEAGQPEIEIRSGEDKLATDSGKAVATISIRSVFGSAEHCGMWLEECEQLGDTLCRIASQARYKR